MAIAVILSRWLGALNILIGVVLVMIVGLSGTGVLEVTTYWTFLATTFVVYLGPGAAILFISFPLERRKHWAPVVMLTIVGADILLSLLVAILALRSSPNTSEMILLVAIPSIICALAIATTFYVARSLRHLRILAQQRRVGFEPVLPTVPSVPSPGSVGPPR